MTSFCFRQTKVLTRRLAMTRQFSLPMTTCCARYCIVFVRTALGYWFSHPYPRPIVFISSDIVNNVINGVLINYFLTVNRRCCWCWFVCAFVCCSHGQPSEEIIVVGCDNSNWSIVKHMISCKGLNQSSPCSNQSIFLLHSCWFLSIFISSTHFVQMNIATCFHFFFFLH